MADSALERTCVQFDYEAKSYQLQNPNQDNYIAELNKFEQVISELTIKCLWNAPLPKRLELVTLEPVRFCKLQVYV